MDVHDENEDLEALRGVKGCLSSDNLHKDIVPPQKNGNSYFANRDITASIGHIPIGDQGGHSETGIGYESGHYETVMPSRGVKRCLAFDNVSTHSTKRNRCDRSYTATHGLLGVTCMVGGGERKSLYNCDGKETSNPKKNQGVSYGEHCGFDTLKKTKKSNCICTCCHADNLNRRSCIIFREALYDMSNAQISDLLQARLKQKNCKELICKKCHTTIEKLNGRSGTTTGMSSHYSVSAHKNGDAGQGSSSITSVSVD